MGGAVATGTLKGALQGAFTGAVFGGLGGHLSNASTSVQVGAHSLAGGVVSKLQGGNFGHGFFSAGFTKWAGKTWHIDTGSARNVIGNSLKQAIIGGTASKITGNKFSNGAFTAALQYIVNEASARVENYFGTKYEARPTGWYEYREIDAIFEPLDGVSMLISGGKSGLIKGLNRGGFWSQIADRLSTPEIYRDTRIFARFDEYELYKVDYRYEVTNGDVFNGRYHELRATRTGQYGSSKNLSAPLIIGKPKLNFCTPPRCPY